MIPDEIAEELLVPPGSEFGQDDIAAVRTALTDFEHQARTLIRQRPVVAVLTAVGVGYVVARIVARATSRRHA